MDWLLAQDRALLLLINGAHSTLGDDVMAFVSNKLTWIPLYILLLVVFVRRLGWRGAIPVLMVTALVILAADQTTSSLLKPLVGRPRPCHEPDLQMVLHLVNGHRGGEYGFASSHAANFFGLALFAGVLLQKSSKWWLLALSTIALLVSYSRVYLGVHYPSDVLAGAIIGLAYGGLGIFLLKFLQKRFNFPQSGIN